MIRIWMAKRMKRMPPEMEITRGEMIFAKKWPPSTPHSDAMRYPQEAPATTTRHALSM